MFYAADRGLLDIVKLFVERKIDLNQRDKEGKTALIYATISNRAEMVKYLLEMGADVNIVDAVRLNNILLVLIRLTYGCYCH